MPAPVLETRSLTVNFGGVLAVNDVSIEIRENELVGLIGPNGAGKSTFIDLVTGFLNPTYGTVRFRGTDVTSLKAHNRVRLGMGRTFQSPELFDDLTVGENLSAFSSAQSVGNVPRLLDELGLSHLHDSLGSECSHAESKLVALARALVNEPTFLLLDEPAAGVDVASRAVISTVIRDFISGTGHSVLLVDHDMDFLMALCSRVYVLASGAIIADGPPALIRTHEAVMKSYLGEQIGPS